MKDQWTEHDVQRMLINPIYVTTVAEVLAQPHSPLVEREVWVRANAKSIAEMGAEAWLRALLDVLEKGQ